MVIGLGLVLCVVGMFILLIGLSIQANHVNWGCLIVPIMFIGLAIFSFGMGLIYVNF